MANKKNLANGFIDGTLSAVATSVDLKAGYADDLPATPFDMVITPFGQMSTLANSEIVKVTNVASDTLTIERAMKGTTAKAFVDGDVVSNGVFVEDVVGLAVTVATGRTTAAKVGTTSDGNYVPVAGDKINVTFTDGISASNPTLNIDSSGAKNIRLATSNVSTAILSTTAATSVTIPMWYDGTGWQLYGSYVANTTYGEISEANIINTGSSSTDLITGRRAEYLMANEASATRTLTNKTLTSPDISTPTGLTKTDVGLGNVTNDAQLKASDLDTDGTLAANSDSKIASQKATKTYTNTRLPDYSTSEQNTGRKWIDGKTIYQKTINLGGLVNNTTKTVAMGITNLSRVIGMDGYARNSYSGDTIPLPIYRNPGNSGAFIFTNDSSGNITVGANDDRSPYTEAYITLYYTKTS